MQETPSVPSQDQTTTKTETLTGALVPGQAIIESSINAVQQALPLVEKIDKAAAVISQKMGDGMKLSEAVKQNLSAGVESVRGLGGTFENATAIQQDFSDIFGRNVVLQKDTYGELFATSQVTGVASKTLLENFADAGIATKNITKEMRTVVEIAQSLGVNASAVSSRVTQNLDKLNRFGFQGGIDGLARMAAQSAVLRTNMDSVFNIAEDLMSPEKAIEMSSALQRLGATTTSLVDPLKLMDLAQNDVGELQNQLGQLFKQYTTFDEKSQKFQIMPSARRDLKMIAQELGMSVEEVTKFAIGTADVEKKLSEISFEGLNIDEDTQNMIANMATMGEGGEYEITTKDEGTVSLQEFLKKYQGREDELKNYFESEAAAAAETPEDKMLAQAKEQLGALGDINATLNKVNDSIGLAVGGSKLGQEILDLAKKNIEIQTEDFLKNFGTSSEAFTTGLNDLAVKLKAAKEGGDFDAGLQAFQDFGKLMLTQTTETATGVLQKYGEVIGKDLNLDLTKIQTDITNAISSFTGGVGGIADTLVTIKGALTSAFTDLGDIIGKVKEKIGMQDGEINVGGQTNIVTYTEGAIQPIETEIGDKIMVYKNETKPEGEYLTEQLSQVEKKVTPQQNIGDEISNTLNQISNNTNNTLVTTTQSNQQTSQIMNQFDTLSQNVNKIANAQSNQQTNQTTNQFDSLTQIVEKISTQKEPTFNVVVPKTTEGGMTEEKNLVNESLIESISNQTNSQNLISQNFMDMKSTEQKSVSDLNKINETLTQSVKNESKKSELFLQETQLTQPEVVRPATVLERTELENRTVNEDVIKNLMLMSQTTNTKSESVVSGGEPIKVSMDYNIKLEGNGLSNLTAQRLEPIMIKILKENNNTQQAVEMALKNVKFGQNKSAEKSISYST